MGMHNYRRKRIDEKKPLSRRFLSTFVNLGNSIIVCLGIVFFGMRRLVNVFKKNKNNQDLLDFLENLKSHLNEGSKPTSAKKQYSPYSNKNINYYNTQNINTKTQVNNSSSSKIFSKKNIIFISAGIGIFATSILIGMLLIGGDKKENKAMALEVKTITNYKNNISNEVDNSINIYAAKKELLIDGPEMSSIAYDKKESLSEELAANNESNIETDTSSDSIQNETDSEELDSELLIHLSDTHEEVAKIQECLMDLHYMDADEPTTYYGVVTHYAMQLFQRGHSLSVDGIAGADTLKLLYSDEATPYMVREGDKGTDIAKIQERLGELGYLSSSSNNGKFDEDTDLAIRVFQGRNKLSQDGIVGHNTTQVLFNGDAKPAKSYVVKNDNTSDDGGGGDSSYDAGDAAALIGYAKSLLNQGIPYVWGGKTYSGLDCSGYVYYCLNKSGYNTGYMTSSSWANSSHPSISKENLKPGDIMCFQGHVAIYLGNGMMIDMSSISNGIRIANFSSSSYWNRKFICGKRVFT